MFIYLYPIFHLNTETKLHGIDENQVDKYKKIFKETRKNKFSLPLENQINNLKTMNLSDPTVTIFKSLYLKN